MTIWQRIGRLTAWAVYVAVCVGLVITAGVYSGGNPWVTGTAEVLAIAAIAQARPRPA